MAWIRRSASPRLERDDRFRPTPRRWISRLRLRERLGRGHFPIGASRTLPRAGGVGGAWGGRGGWLHPTPPATSLVRGPVRRERPRVQRDPVCIAHINHGNVMCTCMIARRAWTGGARSDHRGSASVGWAGRGRRSVLGRIAEEVGVRLGTEPCPRGAVGVASRVHVCTGKRSRRPRFSHALSQSFGRDGVFLDASLVSQGLRAPPPGECFVGFNLDWRS